MVISLRTGQTRELGRADAPPDRYPLRAQRHELHHETPSASGAIRWRFTPPTGQGRAIRVEFFGDEIDRISEINAVTGMPERVVQHVAIYPASHYVASKEKMARAMQRH